MIDNKTLAAIRQEYTLKEFDETHLVNDGVEQFRIWFKEAIDAEVNEPNAMVLATCHHDGRPAARVVLLKAIEPHGFVFYTNYESNKGRQLMEHPYASMVFFWPELQRQIRIEGKVSRNLEKDNDEYFYSRPYESQIGAHASPQSQPLRDRQELEERFRKFQAIFESEPMMRPQHWGGYYLEPDTIEFWQGRMSRLHDRFLFRKAADDTWSHLRLAP